jgi:hypothetical protein
MRTLLKLALHAADERAYRTALELLATLGFDAVDDADPVEGVNPVLHAHAPGSACLFRAAAVGEVPGDPAEICRRVFEVLQGARLRPVAVMGRQLERYTRLRVLSPSRP